jgi:hypothetical protein
MPSRSVGIAVTTSYLYDINDERIAEGANGATTTYPFPFYNVQGSIITKHIFANGEPVADIVTGNSTSSSSSSITFDASSTSITTGFNAGPVTKTWTQACNSCSIIVLNADIWQDTGPIGVITSAKVGGVPMTFVASTTSINIEAEQWYFLATSTGTQNISVTVTGATDAIKLGTASFKGAAASSPLDTSAKTTGSTGNPALSLTTGTANDLVIDTLDRFSTTNATTNQTPIYNDHVTSTLSRFLSEDPNFIQGGPENSQNTESADPQYAALNGFVTSGNSVYLASPQNLNPYSYVDENPLKYTDPSGKCIEDYCITEGLAVLLGAGFEGIPEYVNQYNRTGNVFLDQTGRNVVLGKALSGGAELCA